MLIFCQFVGEVISRAAGLPVPGPVVGLLLLLAGLEFRSRRLRRPPSPELKATCNGLLANLSLLFVPAGVGVITQLDILGANWVAVVAAILVSTFLGLVVTGWVMQRLVGPDDAAPLPPAATLGTEAAR